MKKNERKSNIELYRIVVMLAIISHHYVVNSGLMSSEGPIYGDIVSWRSIFLMMFGAWGKIGINCFVLITGYFMCKSKNSAIKFIKLISEVMFYKTVLSIIFILTGYTNEPLLKTLVRLMPIYSIDKNFVSCFLMMYLAIPYLNNLIQSINKKQFRGLLALLGFIYVFLGTFKLSIISVTMNYFSWFIVIYLIGAYIRLFPEDLDRYHKKWGLFSLASVFLCCLSILLSIRLFGYPYFFVTDSNTFMAIVTSVCLFMYFLNLKVEYSRIINTIASTMFGVLLIHTNSDEMRQWLWRDVFDNLGNYSKSLLPLRAIAAVVIVFCVCSIIDLLRQRIVERPYMKWVETYLMSKR